MLYPMFAIIVLITVVAVLNMCWRIGAVRNRSVSARYFKTYQGDDSAVPEHIIAGGKHYSNLFEVPILFLITAMVVIVLNIQSITFITLSWVFVGSRVLHSIIHLSYNHILHRLIAFVIGVIVVFSMWVMILFQI